jgi:hypothetical protein
MEGVKNREILEVITEAIELVQTEQYNSVHGFGMAARYYNEMLHLLDDARAIGMGQY